MRRPWAHTARAASAAPWRRLVLEAKRELAHSRQSIKAIAHDLGFSDVGYFSRFFRKHTRLSPSEFRSQGAA
ncbi:hypothetical protein AO738_21470 [Pseudomonas citronellolis]|nr:hypothetical protein AO742_02485 [Pseudomonas citronellolis]KRW76017.1 hypothetical protein AO738_21470 [Pseudomonas citronellolis]